MIAGPTGRLGRALLAEAAGAGLPAFPLPSPAFGRDPARGERGVALRRAEIAERLAGVDVFLTATSPAAEELQLPVVAAAGVAAVVATTGLDPPPDWLRRAAHEIPIVIDPNFSQGMQILRRMLRTIGPLPDGFDASLLEAHREDKPDHPSGSARAMAADLAGAGYRGWEAARGARRAGRVEIASLRGGNTPGVHGLWLAGPGELLRVEHVVLDRSTFARGMLMAARWLHARRGRLRSGLYSFSDVLEGARR